MNKKPEYRRIKRTLGPGFALDLAQCHGTMPTVGNFSVLIGDKPHYVRRVKGGKLRAYEILKMEAEPHEEKLIRTLRRSLLKATKDPLFNGGVNTPELRERVRNIITGSIKDMPTGLLNLEIRCDERNNPPEMQENRFLHVDIIPRDEFTRQFLKDHYPVDGVL